MRLIDADALMKEVCDFRCGCEPDECDYADEYGKYCEFAQYIENASTVDAVPVVRCKDCKYWHMMSYRTERLCYHLGHSTDKDWFCPCGRIKE